MSDDFIVDMHAEMAKYKEEQASREVQAELDKIPSGLPYWKRVKLIEEIRAKHGLSGYEGERK